MATSALTYGDAGVGVQALQTSLRALGYSLDVDGIFGDQTKAAVLHFQAAASVTVDGMVGPDTQEAIGRAMVTAWRTNDSTPWDSGGEPTTADPKDYTPGDAAKAKEKAKGLSWPFLLVLAGFGLYLWKSGKLKGVFGDAEEGEGDEE